MIPRCDVLRIIIFLLVFTCVGTICFAEQPESPDWEPKNTPHPFLFIEGAAHFYFAPEMFSDTVPPKPGFRGALGFGWQRLRFSLASGYTRITGTNPLVQDLTFIPLTFRLGYEQPLGKIFSIRLDLGGGLLFSEANLYTSALDNYMSMPTVNKAEINGVAEGRLSAVFTLPGNFLQIYAGGNGYLLPETGGPLFRGAFEAGLVFKIAKRVVPPPLEPEPSPPQPPPPPPEPEPPPTLPEPELEPPPPLEAEPPLELEPPPQPEPEPPPMQPPPPEPPPPQPPPPQPPPPQPRPPQPRPPQPRPPQPPPQQPGPPQPPPPEVEPGRR